MSSAAVPSNQDAWRSSTATRHGWHRSASSAMRRSAAAPRASHGGNWSRTAPSRSAAAIGSSAARNRSHSSSYAAAGGPGAGSGSGHRPGAGRGQRRHRCRVPGEEAERLDVEGEALGRGVHPASCRLRHGHRVVGGVHLDQREAPGVEVEPTGRGVGRAGVPARAQQHLVRPGRRAHLDHTHVIQCTAHRTNRQPLAETRRPGILREAVAACQDHGRTGRSRPGTCRTSHPTRVTARRPVALRDTR